ncbi:MAG: DUF502 domain-containing protein [Bacteroidia bacterium]|jgi:uncharacterized membrane protein|nr:DUF502 domain-containing protein [Bacteroidia bacterium]
MNNLLKYFLQGLVLCIPFGITLIVFVKLFQFFEGLFSFVGLTGYPALDTVISIICVLFIITVIGMLASSFLFKRLFAFFEEKLEHAPFIRHVYSPIKDFMNAFMGNKKRFTKPVLVLTNPQANIEELGFITQDDLSDWGITGKVSVYLPYSYSFSGRLVIVPREQIKPVTAEGGEAMKFIVSGGVTDVEKES